MSLALDRPETTEIENKERTEIVMRRIWALGAVLTLAISACASPTATTTSAGGEEPALTTTSAAGEVTTTAEAMAEEVALRWRTRPDNTEEAGVYQSISDGLDASLEGVALTYEPGASQGADYQASLLTELSAGTAPDVFWIPGTDVANFVDLGVILDLREYADASGHSDDDFYPGPMGHLTTDPETGQPGTQLWGLPRDVSTFALYLNNDLIAEAGAEDPRELAAAGNWTWESFNQVVADVAGLGADIEGFASDAWWGPYGYWMGAAGGGFFNEDRTACGLDTPESVEGLTFVRELFASGNTVAWGGPAEDTFRAGNLAMFMNGRWATPGIRTVDFDFDVVKLPDGPAGPSNWLFWGAYVVNADTADPAAAWSLVEALTTAETQATISELGANIPSRVSQEALDAFLTFSPPANNQAFLDGLGENPATEGPLWVGSWPDYVTGMDAAVGAVINGDRTVEDFQANVCSELAGAFD